MPIGINTPQTMPLATMKAALDVLTAVGGSFHLPTLILYTNNIVPSQNIVYADLIQPTFPGYAPSAALVFAASDNNPGGGAICYAPSVPFACSGGTPSDTIYGWALADSGLTILKSVTPLAAPVSITHVGDVCVIVPQLTFGGQ